MYLVVSITINRKRRRKDFSFARTLSFPEALLYARLCAGFRGAAPSKTAMGHALREPRIWQGIQILDPR